MRILAETPNAFGCSSGAWAVWSLSDGHLDLPATTLNGLVQGEPSPAPLVEAQVRLSVNCFLLRRVGQDTILVDCGAGGSWDDTMGHLGRALAEAGVDPGEIRVLLLTHAHTDHINGLLTREGGEAFLHLDRVLIPAAAVARFNADDTLARFRPRLSPIDAGAELVPGLRAASLPGHAAGHTGYQLDTGEDAILICGDIVHVPERQFARPELTWAYDDDQATARQTRFRVLADAAMENTWLAGAHLGRPGIGRVVRAGTAYRFEALGSAQGGPVGSGDGFSP